MSNMDWYCVHTKPSKELLVEKYLQDELKLDTYYPRLRRHKIIRRVKRQVIEPLFPRYMFCKLDLATSLRAVSYGRDVIGIVRSGPTPTKVGEGTIRQIKAWAGENDAIITIEPESLAKGDKVRVVAGPMQGLEAIFLNEISKGERVSILLDLMNAEARAEIDREQVEPINL